MTKYLNEWSGTAGSNGFTQPDGWPEGITSDKINDIGREQMAVLARWEKDTNGSLLTTGTEPAYAVTLNQTSIAAYYDGMMIAVDFHAANTSAPNINVNSIGAKNIVWPDGTALVSGDITLGMKALLCYDGTNVQMLSIHKALSATSLAAHPASSTDEAIARYNGTAGAVQDSGWTISDADLVTAGGTLAMADNLITRPQIEDYGETVNAIGSIGGGTQDIDLTLGNVVSGTVDTSTTTFTFSNPPGTGIAGSFTLILTNGGSQTVNWPASVDWAAGTAPTLTTSGRDVLTFMTIDAGTIWYGFAAGLAMA